MIEFKQKIFTSDKDVAINHTGDFVQVIKHLLKLKYGFNEKYDGNKHRRDIYNAFLKEILEWVFPEKKGKKTSSKGLKVVYDYYLKFALKKEALRRKIESEFIKDYGFKGKIKPQDFEEAIEVLGYIMDSGSKDEVKDKCKEIFKDYEF